MAEPLVGAEPLVSVVLATHVGDNLQHLTESVHSVVAQTYSSIELIVVCDGPISREADTFLEQVSSEHHWIQVHKLPKQGGPGAARNAVLNKCQGSFVAVFDSDDIMDSQRLATQVRYLQTRELDIVGSWLVILDQEGQQIGIRKFPESWQMVRSRSAFYCPTANTSTLFRSELLPTYRYPESLSVGEDYRLWVYLMRRGCRIGNVQQPLTGYRTGSTYYQRRTGRAYAVSDLRTKLSALDLAPWWQRPLVIAGALVTVPVRMLPPTAFRVAYRMFEGATGRSRE